MRNALKNDTIKNSIMQLVGKRIDRGGRFFHRCLEEKNMDTFMDKLAQKLNAQEMIRANTSAELEELGQVKEQIQELKGCVEQMQTAAKEIQDGNQALAEKMAGMAREGAVRNSETVAGDGDVIYILEEEVSQLSADFAQFRQGITDQNSDFTGLEQKVQDNGEGILRLSQQLVGLSDDVASFREEVAQLHDELTMDQNVEQDGKEQEDADAAVLESLGRIDEGVARCCQDFEQSRAEISQLREGIGYFREEISRLQDAQSGDEDVIKELKDELALLAERLTRVSESSTAKNAETMDALKRFLIDQLSKIKPEQTMSPEQKEALAKQSAALEEQKAVLEEIRAAQAESREEYEKKLTGVHEGLREGYHKECVKVYRNVQAAFIEENEKQTVMQGQTLEKIEGKSFKAMLFALLAFVVSVVGIVLQILSILKIV